MRRRCRGPITSLFYSVLPGCVCALQIVVTPATGPATTYTVDGSPRGASLFAPRGSPYSAVATSVNVTVTPINRYGPGVPTTLSITTLVLSASATSPPFACAPAGTSTLPFINAAVRRSEPFRPPAYTAVILVIAAGVATACAALVAAGAVPSGCCCCAGCATPRAHDPASGIRSALVHSPMPCCGRRSRPINKNFGALAGAGMHTATHASAG